MQDRINALIARFDGAIKYTPMLTDHPDWTDDQCEAFAREHHASAILGLIRLKGAPGWNNGIPYCRNLPTEKMLKEAGLWQP